MPFYVFLNLLPGASTVQVAMSLRTAFMGANIILSVSPCPDMQASLARGFRGDFSPHTLSSEPQCYVPSTHSLKCFSKMGFFINIGSITHYVNDETMMKLLKVRVTLKFRDSFPL